MVVKLSSNGFGSFNFHLNFIVQKPYDQFLIDDQWEIVSTEDTSTTFVFYFHHRKTGDDELAVYELGHSLPASVPTDAYTIDWDNSVI